MTKIVDKKYTLNYNGKYIEYEIKKARVKNIYIHIKNGKVEVKVPKYITIKYATELVEKRKKWIFDTLKKQEKRESRNIDLKNNSYLYLLDKKIEVKYVETQNKKIKVELGAKICFVFVPKSTEKDDKFYQEVEEKIKKEEKKIAEERVDIAMKKYISLTGYAPKSYSVRIFKSIWGNCSSQKVIKINQNIIMYSQKEIEYVCLHEICHLKYMNHQKEFWAMVKKYMPDYKESIRKLKE